MLTAACAEVVFLGIEGNSLVKMTEAVPMDGERRVHLRLIPHVFEAEDKSVGSSVVCDAVVDALD